MALIPILNCRQGIKDKIEKTKSRNKEYSEFPALTQNESGLNLYNVEKEYYNREKLKQTIIHMARPDTKEYFLQLSINKKYN